MDIDQIITKIIDKKASKSKTKEITISPQASKQIIQLEPTKSKQKSSHKETTRKQSEKPSKMSKQQASKTETSFGLVAEPDVSKKSKRSEPEKKQASGFGFFGFDDAYPQEDKSPSIEEAIVQPIKKRGRPRKDVSMSMKKDETASKRFKKSNSVGAAPENNEVAIQIVNEKPTKKRGRPKKNHDDDAIQVR